MQEHLGKKVTVRINYKNLLLVSFCGTVTKECGLFLIENEENAVIIRPEYDFQVNLVGTQKVLFVTINL